MVGKSLKSLTRKDSEGSEGEECVQKGHNGSEEFENVRIDPEGSDNHSKITLSTLNLPK